MDIGSHCITVNCNNQGRVARVVGYLPTGEVYNRWTALEDMIIVKSLGTPFDLITPSGRVKIEEAPFPKSYLTPLEELPGEEKIQEIFASHGIFMEILPW